MSKKKENSAAKVEVIVKVIHEYPRPQHDTQYKQSHPDEYEWSNFWNDWVPITGSR